uniref:Putative ribonuclease H-like domain-containing protein n=1 Tax=Tanacetum cinerariifolium TaxID=118510 RepID=A0A699GXW3_TANCI|nr:putative ribonuclease H-like domain-containing protein [Tanacetum cinerariifolium]
MDQDSAHMVVASKVPMLKPGEHEIWRIRIEQYIQMIDYALWEVIENALVSCDGLGGYDWSDQAEKGPNYALMAFLSSNYSSEVSNDSTCLKSCLETVKLLKSQNEQLLKDLEKSELMVLGNFMPPTPDFSFTSIDEFVNKHVVENCKAKSSEEVPKTVDLSQDPKSSNDDGSKPSSNDGKKADEDPRKNECNDQEKENNVNSTNNVNTVSSTVNSVGTNGVNAIGEIISSELPFDPNMPALEDVSTFDFSRDDEDDDAVADMNNSDTTIQVSPTPTTRIHKDHPLDQLIRDLQSATQTRKMLKNLEEHGFISTIQQRTNHKDLQNFLFACFLSHEEPKRNKERLVAQVYTQEEEIEYDEVFAPVARIEAIRLFLAYASFKDFVGYQMDVKSDFLYGKIEEDVYVCQPPEFEDLDFPDRVYKVKKALYGLHQAPKAWYETLSTYSLDNGFQRGKTNKTLFIKRHKGDILLVQVYVDDIIFGSTKKELCLAFEKLMHEKFQMSSMGELTFFLGLQVKQKIDGIFISQDKYVAEILKKFRFTKFKTASTPMETQKPLLKDEDNEEVDVHMYRSRIGLLMYLTSLRPDIMFACKKQSVVANSIIEAEYVAASSCYGQVLWIQNQLLDYGVLYELVLLFGSLKVSVVKYN